ncbi:hypothetical protein HCN51_13285 [Nonomuraea sp. FMUSA5-5]|uniref:Uncharacterized protein n=1 Tax=Nonomuraea composti TaxID=2720023 RepID=A0ABX1AXT8_9ACTN|nr:hypothetical protein [Nonomuraea sp. FMUSA5-5]NJP90415.1 hypothetical protein [Nonomuraea sp. FMUSA5-5]
MADQEDSGRLEHQQIPAGITEQDSPAGVCTGRASQRDARERQLLIRFRLSACYQRNRIRERSPFWVDVIQLGHSRPASGVPGIVATEALYPEEISDFRGCGIDGVDNPIGPN